MNVLDQLGAEFAQVTERDARELAVHSGRQRRATPHHRRLPRRPHGLFATVLVLGIGGGATMLQRDGQQPSRTPAAPALAHAR